LAGGALFAAAVVFVMRRRSRPGGALTATSDP
jgi:hypothetical protein